MSVQLVRYSACLYVITYLHVISAKYLKLRDQQIKSIEKPFIVCVCIYLCYEEVYVIFPLFQHNARDIERPADSDH